MRRHPHLYEINARLFARRMSKKYGRNLTLATIPDEEWQYLAHLGFDLVWLMGVWQRSPGARREALLNPGLRQEYDRVLPGWTDEDIAGSPYAIYGYDLDSALGQPSELYQLKAKLNLHGLRLVVDFVPNHLAFDHPWTLAHPDWFVCGEEANIRAHPDWFFSPEKDVHLAHGRDLYFPPWTDTAQVNFYSTGLRRALLDKLLKISKVADGVRCDMAMLALNDIFGQIWGGVVRSYPRPATEFWVDAIGQVKQWRPDFLFLAEVYWGLEGKLQQMGFDFTYDKLLYDRLRSSTPDDIRRHLGADGLYQQHSAHFIENHDEPRAVAIFGRERSLAAAAAISTVPGLRFFHDGQFEGYRIHLPVQMVREPEEVVDNEIAQFYAWLLAACNAPAFHDGEWQLLEPGQVREGNDSYRNLLAWSWSNAKELKIAVINYSPSPAQGWLKLTRVKPGKSVFRDELTAEEYVVDTSEVETPGLSLDLEAYQARILDVIPA